MRILWFNWRDIKNPTAGGAEVFTHEIMRRLVEKGHDLTLFTTSFPSGPINETIDGVKVIRNGGKYSVYSKAKKYYRIASQHYDIIIDGINTRPFLTPKFVKEKPILAVFYQLAREFWFYETNFPLNYIGYYYLEKKWLSYYKNIMTVTISNSSKADLQELEFNKIAIVPIGLNIDPLPAIAEKELVPTIVFIGRLKKAKRPDHALQAFNLIKKEFPEAKMWVIGDGYMLEDLKKFETKDIIFHGHISTEKKYELLSKAHLILVPAVREGWGLIVTEANAVGTPAVAYDVPGIRDAIIDGKTGILVKENTPDELAAKACVLLRDRNLLMEYSRNALVLAKQFNWDKTADIFNEILMKTVGSVPDSNKR